MSEESERTFVVEIPERYYEYREFIIPLLEAVASASRPKRPGAAVKKAGDDADPAGILANEILELLHKQGTDSKNSSPHGLVILVVQLVKNDRPDLAERTIAAAAADPQISRRMRSFFASLPDDERPEPADRWPGKLRELLSKPRFATLGKTAASRIATRNQGKRSRQGEDAKMEKTFYEKLRDQVDRKVRAGTVPKSVATLLTASVVLSFGASAAKAMGFSPGRGAHASLAEHRPHRALYY